MVKQHNTPGLLSQHVQIPVSKAGPSVFVVPVTTCLSECPSIYALAYRCWGGRFWSKTVPIEFEIQNRTKQKTMRGRRGFVPEITALSMLRSLLVCKPLEVPWGSPREGKAPA